MRRPSSVDVNHSDSGFGNCRRRPVFGSRRVWLRFQTHVPMYLLFRRSRWIVDADQPFEPRRPTIPSAFNIRTILDSDHPPAKRSKIRRITDASLGSTTIRYPSGRWRPFLSIRTAPTGMDRYPNVDSPTVK